MLHSFTWMHCITVFDYISHSCTFVVCSLPNVMMIYAKAICPRTSVTESVGAALFYRENNVKPDKKDKEGRQ